MEIKCQPIVCVRASMRKNFCKSFSFCTRKNQLSTLCLTVNLNTFSCGSKKNGKFKQRCTTKFDRKEIIKKKKFTLKNEDGVLRLQKQLASLFFSRLIFWFCVNRVKLQQNEWQPYLPFLCTQCVYTNVRLCQTVSHRFRLRQHARTHSHTHTHSHSRIDHRNLSLARTDITKHNSNTYLFLRCHLRWLVQMSTPYFPFEMKPKYNNRMTIIRKVKMKIFSAKFFAYLRCIVRRIFILLVTAQCQNDRLFCFCLSSTSRWCRIWCFSWSWRSTHKK